MRYEIRANLSPELHDGHMKYMAQVVYIDATGTFTLYSVFKRSYIDAVGDVESYARKQGWLKGY
jgi:hypothetical protein